MSFLLRKPQSYTTASVKSITGFSFLLSRKTSILEKLPEPLATIRSINMITILFSLFPFFMCVCVCGMYVYMCTCTYGRPRLTSGIFLDRFSTLFIEARFLSQIQNRLIWLVPLGICLLRLELQVGQHTYPVLTWVSGLLNSGPYACTISTLTAKSSFQFHHFDTNVVRKDRGVCQIQPVSLGGWSSNRSLKILSILKRCSILSWCKFCAKLTQVQQALNGTFGLCSD